MSDNRSFIIYVAVCNTTGKRYVGQTVWDLKRRQEKHFWDALHSSRGCPYFHAAIRKYGESAFEFYTLMTVPTKEQADEQEKNIIQLLSSCDPKFGYNISKGGGGAVGCKRSPETLEKMSAWQRGRKLSLEHRANISQAMRGSVINVGRKHDSEWVKKTAAPLGVKHSSEHNSKISKGLQNHYAQKKITGGNPQCLQHS
jgi:group I intron endonuclease